MDLIEEKNLKKIESLTKEIELKGDESSLYVERGVVFDELEDNEKAIQDFTRAIRVIETKQPNPLYFRAYFFRGNSHRKLKEFEKAIEDYSKSIALNPRHSHSYINRGLANSKMSEHDIAIIDCSKAIEIESSISPQNISVSHRAYVTRGNSFNRMGFHLEAIGDYTEAIKLKPQDPVAYIQRGNAYQLLNEHRKSLKDFNKAIKVDPLYHISHNNLGYLYYTIGEYENAVKGYSESIELNPHYGMSFFGRGLSYYCLKQYNLALHDFNRSIELDSKSSLAYFCRSLTFRNIKDFERFSLDLKTAKQLDPNVENAYTRVKQGCNFVVTDRNELDILGRKILDLQKNLKIVHFEDLIIKRRLGIGSYGNAYLCNVKNFSEEFVVKIYSGWFLSEGKKLELRQRDSLYLKYHPNLVTILSHSDKETIHLTKLPDYEEFWKEKVGKVVLNDSPMILMLYYPGDLHHFLEKIHKGKLSSLRICKILQGIISGINYLHQNMIVHRDLHLKNILIDEKLERVWICDFGCSLDLRHNRGIFVVHKTNERLYSRYSGTTDGGTFRIGGAPSYLPPEIINGSENDKVEYLDYEKCDIFSVGKIGERLLGKADVGDKGFKLVSSFIDKFLVTNPKMRIGYYEAVSGIRKLTLHIQRIL